MSTKTPPKVKCWVVTINNYTDDDITTLRDLEEILEYAVIGKEEAPTTGTPHLQGFLKFTDRRRRTQVNKYLNRRADIRQAIDPDAAIEYCKKGGNFFEIGTYQPAVAKKGKRTDLDLFKDDVKAGILDKVELRDRHSKIAAMYPRFFQDYIRDNIPKKDVTDHDLREWQIKLKELLDGEINAREIVFIVDETGDTGKTWFAHWYATNHENCQVMIPGKKADMNYALRPPLRVLFIDAPRSKQGEFLQYDFLEEVKNGYVFSTKYESNLLTFTPPHVVVLMNELPDMSKLSQDRYRIINI
jgi:hypothetical protein